MTKLKKFDWTKQSFRPICPKCGRRGIERVSPKGSIRFNHKGKEVELPGIGIGTEITEHCYIGPTDPKQPLSAEFEAKS